jgi:hypothetical protein
LSGVSNTSVTYKVLTGWVVTDLEILCNLCTVILLYLVK